ncbi:hypothetical protein NUW54_g5526 [Trametes sanguinea]|uniref:Uncharacterized protein n=1 Tax=Trametes sanguinea TaxID=158606 RepID=A0ACC1PW24_9APHY|nr:hypothetical protein NUW54_g5526 [Trametes sanguinea]
MSSVQFQNAVFTVRQALFTEGPSTTYSPMKSAESWLAKLDSTNFEDFEFVFSSRTPSSSAFSTHAGDAALLDTPSGTALCSSSSLSNTSNSSQSPRRTSSTCMSQPSAPFVAAEGSQSDETLVVGLAEIEAAAEEAKENPPSVIPTVHPEAGPSTAVRSGSPPRGIKRRREIQKTEDKDERSLAGRVMSDEEDVPVAGLRVFPSAVWDEQWLRLRPYRKPKAHKRRVHKAVH